MAGITDPAEDYFKDGIWGWNGSAWRKLALIPGISSLYREVESSIGVGAGTQNLQFSACPAGKMRIISQFSARCTTANPTYIILLANLGGKWHFIEAKNYNNAYTTISTSGPIYLEAGDYLNARFSACQAGDDIYAYASGYEMEI